MPRPEDQQFADAALSRNLISDDELQPLYAEIDRQAAEGQFVRLCDLVVERGILSEATVAELQQASGTAPSARQVGGFEVISKIGSGGMGAVYQARQISMDRIVALKILPSKYARKPKYIERFFQEARASAKLAHPNIVQGIDVGLSDGFYFYAMEFIDGETLGTRLKRETRIPEDEALQIMRPVVKALDYACRQAGLIHRDLKPDNIMVNRNGVPKVVDLGLAKTTTEDAPEGRTAPMGSPHYMSPEQVRGLPDVDTRSDIYSLGCTLYHMVTGTTPYSGKTAQELMKQHITMPIDPPETRLPELTPGLCFVINKMIAKRRNDRYQTMAELAGDLDRLDQGLFPQGMETSSTGRRRRLPWWVWPAAASIVVLALVIHLVTPDKDPVDQPPPPPSKNPAEAAWMRALDYGIENPDDLETYHAMLEQVRSEYPASEFAVAARDLAERVKRRMKDLEALQHWRLTHANYVREIDRIRESHAIPPTEGRVRVEGDDPGDDPVVIPDPRPDPDPDPDPDPVDQAAIQQRLVQEILESTFDDMVQRRFVEAEKHLDNLPDPLVPELAPVKPRIELVRQQARHLAGLWKALVDNAAGARPNVLYQGKPWQVVSVQDHLLTIKSDTEGLQKAVDLSSASMGLVVGLLPPEQATPVNTALLHFFCGQFNRARTLLEQAERADLAASLETIRPQVAAALKARFGDRLAPEPGGEGSDEDARQLMAMVRDLLKRRPPDPRETYALTTALLSGFGRTATVTENLDLIKRLRTSAAKTLSEKKQFKEFETPGRLIVVSRAGVPGAFKTIGQALDSAVEGSTIEIHGGVYEENLEIFDRKGLLVRARLGDWVIIRGDLDKPSKSTLYAKGCTDVVFRNVVIGGSRFLVNFEQSEDVVLEDCLIVNETAAREEAAVEFRRSTGCILRRCIINNTTRGLNIERSRGCRVIDNLFIGCPSAGVELLAGAAGNVIRGNYIQGSNGAILGELDLYRSNEIDANYYHNCKAVLRDFAKPLADTVAAARGQFGTKNDANSTAKVIPEFRDPGKGDYRVTNVERLRQATGNTTAPGPDWTMLRWWLARKAWPWRENASK